MKRPDNRDSFEAKAKLNEIGNAVAALLPQRFIESYRELVAVGEGQVALENLCSNLDDCNVPLSADLLTELRDACRRFNVAPKYWQDVNEA